MAGDKFMLEIHLRQPTFTFSACRPFIWSKERIRIFKETGHSRYTYQDELGKTCFQHDMAHGNFKYFPKRTTSDKVLCDTAFSIFI